MFSFIKNLFGSKPKAIISKSKLLMMTKSELEKFGRKHGIELDRRFAKDTLVDELHAHLKKNK
tara:strand:+ start:5750 stop:5938 length:189 start_codon:yes stop_codon:yes gene_type:complete